MTIILSLYIKHMGLVLERENRMKVRVAGYLCMKHERTRWPSLILLWYTPVCSMCGVCIQV